MTPPAPRMNYCPNCREQLATIELDGVERLMCTARCGFVFWDNPTPVVAALIRQGDHYLLARNAQWPAGVFSLVSGFLEKGELPDAAMRRETQEELGAAVENMRFLGHFMLHRFNQLIIGYEVTISGPVALSEEIAELRSIGADELRHYDFGAFATTTAIVAAALSGN